MRSTFVVLAAMSLVFGVSASAQAAGQTGPISPSVIFTDATGDAGTAADIKQISVSNDANGQYTITTDLATTFGSQDSLLIFLNTDMNTATGNPNEDGADYAIAVDHDSNSAGLAQWNGSSWVDAPSSSTVSASTSSDGMEIVASANKTDLGNSTGFTFFEFSANGDGSAGHYDDAPSGSGDFTYTMQPVESLTIAAARQTRAKAGGTWSIFAGATRSDNGQLLGTEGTITCRGTAGGKKLLSASLLVSVNGVNVATCVFKVPRKFKGKALHGTITLSYLGASASKSFTTRAR